MKNVNEGLYINTTEKQLDRMTAIHPPTHDDSACLLGGSRSTITESVGLRGGLGVGGTTSPGVDGHEERLDNGTIESLSALYAS